MVQKTSNKRITMGAIISYVSIGIEMVLGFVYTPWMINQIGSADYGIYSLVLSVLGFFTLDFGIGGAVTKYICEYRAKNQPDKIELLLGTAYRLFFIMDAIIFIALVVFYFLINNIYVTFTLEELHKLKVVFVIAGLFSVMSFPFVPLNGTFNAYEQFKELKMIGILNKLTVTFFIIITLLMGYGLYTLVIVNSFVGIVTILVKIIYVDKKLHVRPDFKHKSKKMFLKIFSFSSWMTISNLCKMMTLSFCPTILGMVSGGATEIAYFSLGRIFHTYTLTIAQALNGLFLPKVTNIITLEGENKQKRIVDLMIKVGNIQLIIIAIIVIGFSVLGRDFVQLWVGDEFQKTFYVALLIMIPLVITTTQEIANTLIMAENKIMLWAMTDFVVMIICLVLAFPLASRYGAVGVAIAYFIASIIGYVFMANIIFYKVLHLDVKKFFIKCHLKMCIPVVITLACGFAIQFFIKKNSIIIFGAKGVVLVAIYAVAVWLFFLSKEEKDAVLHAAATLKNRLRFHK